MRIPLTVEEKGAIMHAARANFNKRVTWARDVLLRAAKRKA